MNPRVLVLDGQTNQALACIRSLGRAGYSVLVASHRRWPLGAWSTHCGGHFRLPAETREAFASLRTWAVNRGIGAVLPLTERTCLLCNLDREAWEESGIRVGCGSQDMLMHAFDKKQALQHASDMGLRTPSTRTPESLQGCRAAVEEVGLPCVVKPRFSHAWDGTRFLPDHGPGYVSQLSDLEKTVQGRRQGKWWPLIQEFTPGRGRGIFALYDRGKPVVWFAHKRLRDVRPSGSGSSLRRSVTVESQLRDTTHRLLSELRWHGPAMVEYQDDGGDQPCFMEINGRFWGSLQLAITAGVDFPRMWMTLLMGERVETPAGYRKGVTQRWLLGDVRRFISILGGPPHGFPDPYPTRMQGIKELFGRQPTGTRLETWDRTDPWPALGEWVQGLGELGSKIGRASQRRLLGRGGRDRALVTVPRAHQSDAGAS